jgi:hypothetical protein
LDVLVQLRIARIKTSNTILGSILLKHKRIHCLTDRSSVLPLVDVKAL